MLGHKAPHLVFDFNPTADSIRHKTDNIISQERFVFDKVAACTQLAFENTIATLAHHKNRFKSGARFIVLLQDTRTVPDSMGIFGWKFTPKT
ncbi:hypothetical protein EV178_000885 [Coemansia sp. RSA 1646]|nr:hypothetical protein EV178_000885 [Coemansia sp. RSA 1646]